MTNMAIETIAAQAAGAMDRETGAIVPAIHIATTFERDPDNQYRRGFLYARPDNATVRQAEAVITALEAGAATLLLGSGMAAATTLMLALPRPTHIVAPTVMYWALKKWLIEDGPTFGITTTFCDTAHPGELAAAFRPGTTKLLWLETPGNPLWTITDIAAAAKLAKAAGALTAVDSTVATPVLTRPLSLGADVVMHAATKYLNGHSDVVGGFRPYLAKMSLL
jgi:cystathionine gamma-synthase